MKRTRLLPLARVIVLPFIGYVVHKHGPSTGNKVCAVPRTAYITPTTSKSLDLDLDSADKSSDSPSLPATSPAPSAKSSANKQT